MVQIKKLKVKDVVTGSPDESVQSGIEKMVHHRISSLVIVDAHKKPVGIMTERDLLNKVLLGEKAPKKMRIREIMSSRVICVDIEKDVLFASQLMKDHKIKQLPITKNDVLVGIITQTDLTWSFYEYVYLLGYTEKEMIIGFFIFCLFYLVGMYTPIGTAWAWVFLGFLMFSHFTFGPLFLSNQYEQ